MKTPILSLTLAALLSLPAAAEDMFTFNMQVDFDDAVFIMEQAITERGLVIDSVSHVGAMLARTKEDVGGTKDLFAHAQIMSFCSAAVSREVMEAKITNIQYCPYNIYIYQMSDDAPVTIGYREFAEPTMRPVNYLLQQIVASAIGSE